MSENNKRQKSKLQERSGNILRTDEKSKDISIRDEFTDAILSQQVEFHKTIFPSKSTKEIIAYQSKLLKQRADANLEGHRMLYEFQRQSIKTALDAVLMQGKQKVISQTNASFLDQMEVMSTNLMSIVNRSNISLEVEFLKLSKMKIKEMRESKKELLLALNGKFHREMIELIERYQRIKDELV